MLLTLALLLNQFICCNLLVARQLIFILLYGVTQIRARNDTYDELLINGSVPERY